VSVANQYLEELTAANTKSKKDMDEHDQLVAKEFVMYGMATKY
jgi:hypothetical protein